MSIEEQLSGEIKKYSNSSNYFFKLQEGENKLRILSEGAVLAQHFFGPGVKPSICYGINKGCPFHGDKAPKDAKGDPKNPSIKYTCYILDRFDDSIKTIDLPYSVIKKIGEYQKDDEWSFDSFPMPYDVKITFQKKDPKTGKDVSPNDMYKVIGSPKREPIAEDKLQKLQELMSKYSPEVVVEKKKNDQMQEHISQGIWIDPTTIPKSDLSEQDAADIKAIRERAIEQQNANREADISVEDVDF